MKKVLVLNGDSYVGRHVVKAFYQSQEYDVEITRTKSDARLAVTNRATATALAQGWAWDGAMADGAFPAAPPSPDHQRRRRRTSGSTHANINTSSDASRAAADAQRRRESLASLPADIRSCVTAVLPKHNDDTEAFRLGLLANDVVVAVLEDDAYEATCAIRILESAHYEVEKTFVLVSSVVTWAYTLESERARARQTRQRERAEARDAFFNEILDEEDEAAGDDAEDDSPAAVAARAARRSARRRELEPRLPPSLRDPLPGEDEEEIRELVPDRVFTEDGYAQRVPHPRFQHWHALEHLVKRANTQTLHTYVVFAGLPYGAGEGEAVLYGLLRSAWYHQALLQYGPGTNALPMIHVRDLAAILFKLGNSYDTLEERYLFAVDQGRVTQRQLLQAVQAKLGGSVQPAVASQHVLQSVSAAAAKVMGEATLPQTRASAVVSAADGETAVPTRHSAGNRVNSASSPSPQAAAATAAAGAAMSADLVRLHRLQLPPPFASADLCRVFGNTPCWGDGGVLLSTLVLSDIQAEPAAALNLHPAEEWVALEGFTSALDVVVAEFRAARGEMFRPVRALITGPPLAGAETLAGLVAAQCHAPFLSLPRIVTDYATHVSQVREALRGLLVRRLERRRGRVQARLQQRAEEERATRKAARAEKRRARLAARKARRGKGGSAADDDEDGEEGNAQSGSDGEEPREGGGDDDGDGDRDADRSGSDSFNSSLSVFLPPLASSKGAGGEGGDGEEEEGDGGEEDEAKAHSAAGSAVDGAGAPSHSTHPPLRPAEEVVDEAYIRGAAAAGDGDDDDGEGGGEEGEGNMIDEEQEEGDGDGDGGEGRWLDALEEADAERQTEMMEGQELLAEGTTTATAGEAVDGSSSSSSLVPRFAARRRGRAFARDVDRQELRCVAALRREYLLGLKVLGLRVSAEDGRLPRPPPPPRSGDDNDEEEGEEDDDGAAAAGGGRRVGSGRPRSARSNGDQDEDEEEGEEGNGDGSDAASGGQRSRPHTGGAASGGGHGEEADEENEGEEEEEEGEEKEGDTDASRASFHASAHVADSAADPSLYLDSALAFMLRWRLRQADCRCQGYVLGNFPQNLSQAVLCFRANEAELEDTEVRRQRALAPFLTAADDHEASANAAAAAAASGGADGDDDGAAPLPPPLDEDFPLPDVPHMDEEALRSLERAHWRSRGSPSGRPPGAASGGGAGDEAEAPDPEEVMAPVDESLFVDYVVSLEANATLLKASAEALETSLTHTSASAAGATATAAAGESGEAGDEESSRAVAIHALQSLLTTTPFAQQLELYARHHSATAPPTQSLLAWLRAITTTPALGVRPPPVMVPRPDTLSDPSGTAGSPGQGGGEDGDDAAAGAEAPATTRTAELISLPAPVLSVAEVTEAWVALFHRHRKAQRSGVEDEAAVLVKERLPAALLRLAPLFWTGGTLGAEGRRPQHAAQPVSTPPALPPPSLVHLQEVVCRRLVSAARQSACGGGGGGAASSSPPASGQGRGDDPFFSSRSARNSAASEPSQSPCAPAAEAAVDESVDAHPNGTTENAGPSGPGRPEVRLSSAARREVAAEVLQERSLLRKLQLAEGSREAASLLDMPAEAYLMKYVLPSLTPAMTEVVRTRSDDPVTALANVLFEYQRRTTI